MPPLTYSCVYSLPLHHHRRRRWKEFNPDDDDSNGVLLRQQPQKLIVDIWKCIQLSLSIDYTNCLFFPFLSLQLFVARRASCRPIKYPPSPVRHQHPYDINPLILKQQRPLERAALYSRYSMETRYRNISNVWLGLFFYVVLLPIRFYISLN